MSHRIFRASGLVILLLIACSVGARAEPLAGTKPLAVERDFASDMVDGIDRFLLRETERTAGARGTLWKRDLSSQRAYEQSVEPNRARLAKMIGVVDARERPARLELLATTTQPALVERGSGFEAYAVRWPVLRGASGEGLLLRPAEGAPVADVIAVPDADQTPEMLAGLAAGVAPESQFARRLAEAGCRVLVPTLIDRADTYSVTPGGQRTNQPHREYVYRPAFEMGRHPIGDEGEKGLAGGDFFCAHRGASGGQVGVVG